MDPGSSLRYGRDDEDGALALQATRRDGRRATS
jgi:hypothetical protein